MDIEHINSFKDLFDNIYKGNQVATRLSFELLDYAHLWDDLIDRDTPVSDESINRVMLSALTSISCSSLWGPHLATIVQSAYFRWHAANNIERNKASTDNDLAKAWMLRAGLYDVFVLIAAKLYGQEWAESVSVKVYGLYGEQLADFIKEIRNA